MPGTLSTAKSVSTACAVFKIDFKGRFVYVDDETEELFGLTREELFGKSFYEFISNDSHQVLDIILGRHNRYESFYESLPLTIRDGEGQYRRLESVLTLNFISGNPVNYQFIMIPDPDAAAAPPVNWERRLLEMTQLRPDEIDFSHLAEMFCAISGYAAGECFLNDNSRNLKMVGSYPHNDPGHSAPIYLEHFRGTGETHFSFIPEDRLREEGFGKGKSEAVLPLKFERDQKLLIWLSGPAEYQPPAPRLEDLRIFMQIWDTHYRSADSEGSAAARFTVLGQTAEALDLGLLIVGDDSEIIYRNDRFSEMAGTRGKIEGAEGFKALYDSLEVCDLQTRPLPYEDSPFARSIRERRLTVDCLNLRGCDHPVTVLAGPVKIAELQLFVYCLIPYYERSAEAVAMNRSGTRLILSVAHDIRAPLITIEAFAKRLQSNYKEVLDNDGRFAVDCIAENGQILQDMINGLGQMSQNWIMQETPEKLYPKQIIDELVNYLKSTYPNTDYAIKMPDGTPAISAPKQKFTQLFRNLLDNAFKYSASVNRPSVRIEYDLVDGHHRFSIADNGPGIEGEYREKVFAPFFRSPDAITLPGTGMGLTIAADIISSWGGRIWIDGEYKNGARVMFTLPPHMKG